MTPEAREGPGLTRSGSIRLRSAFVISFAGDWIYRFVVPTVILRLTGSAIATAVAYVLEFVPYVVVGPFAGVLADRFSRRHLMIACDVGSCALALLLAGLAGLGHPPVAALYACALALACVRPLYFPALQGFLVEAVPAARRPWFNSWTQVTEGLLGIAGPVLGTAIVAAAGASLATVLDAASFAASALLVATIAHRRARFQVMPPDGPRGGFAGVLRELAAGVRAMAISRAILAGTILITGANFAAFVIEGNLVYLILDAEHQPKVALGVVFAAQGAGAVIGAAAAPRLLARQPTGRLLAAGMGLSALAMAVPAIMPRWPAIVTGQGIEGAATALIVVCWFSALQRLIPEDTIGRFVAAGRAIAYAAIPAGALLGAWLLTFTTRTLFVCAAVLQVAIFGFTLRSALIHIDNDEAQPASALSSP
jgi:predicted MFS family arabinose efflux permease